MSAVGTSCRGIVAVLVVVALASPAGWGQEAPGRGVGPARVVDADDLRASLPDPTLDEDLPLRRVVVKPEEDVSMYEGIRFDQRFSGGTLTQGQIRARLDGALAARLDRIATEHRLTAPEMAKLRLAGRGDIKRLIDRIDAARSGFDAAKQKRETALPALEEVDRIATLYHSAPFDRGSLLAKTTARIVGERGAPPGDGSALSKAR